MRYACQVWGLINFKHFMESSNPIYKEMQLKLAGPVLIQAVFHVSDHL